MKITPTKQTFLTFLLVLLFSAQSAPAVNLRDDLLRIHANLLPKTVLMDYKFEQKLQEKTISIGLLCRTNNFFYARQLQKYLTEKYKNGISGMGVTVQIFEYDDAEAFLFPATLYYLLPTSAEQIRETLQKIPANRLTFVYDPRDLQYGAHIGLHIGRQIRPIINIDALKTDGITLRPAIIKISELYRQDALINEKTN